VAPSCLDQQNAVVSGSATPRRGKTGGGTSWLVGVN